MIIYSKSAEKIDVHFLAWIRPSSRRCFLVKWRLFEIRNFNHNNAPSLQRPHRHRHRRRRLARLHVEPPVLVPDVEPLRLVALVQVDGLLVGGGGEEPFLVLGGLGAADANDGEGGRGDGVEDGDGDVEGGGGPGCEGVGGGEVLGWVERVEDG